MEYHGKFEHKIGRIQHIYIMISIEIFYTVFYLRTQNMAPTLSSLQDLKCCIQYLDSHPLKPIFYPSDSYDGSNCLSVLPGYPLASLPTLVQTSTVHILFI